MLSVSYRVTNDILKEYLEYTTSLLVDKSRNTLYTTTTRKTTDGRLRNTLDIITKYFTMTLGSSLS